MQRAKWRERNIGLTTKTSGYILVEVEQNKEIQIKCTGERNGWNEGGGGDLLLPDAILNKDKEIDIL